MLKTGFSYSAAQRYFTRNHVRPGRTRYNKHACACIGKVIGRCAQAMKDDCRRWMSTLAFEAIGSMVTEDPRMNDPTGSRPLIS